MVARNKIESQSSLDYSEIFCNRLRITFIELVHVSQNNNSNSTNRT